MNLANVLDYTQPEQRALNSAQSLLFSLPGGAKHVEIKARLKELFCRRLGIHDSAKYELVYCHNRVVFYALFIRHLIDAFIVGSGFFMPRIMLFKHDALETRNAAEVEMICERLKIDYINFSCVSNWNPEQEIRSKLSANLCFINAIHVNQFGFKMNDALLEVLAEVSVSNTAPLCLDLSHSILQPWFKLPESVVANTGAFYVDAMFCNGIHGSGFALIQHHVIDGFNAHDKTSPNKLGVGLANFVQLMDQNHFAFQASIFAQSLSEAMLLHMTDEFVRLDRTQQSLEKIKNLKQKFFDEFKKKNFKFAEFFSFRPEIHRGAKYIVFMIDPRSANCADNCINFSIWNGQAYCDISKLHDKLISEDKILTKLVNVTSLLEVSGVKIDEEHIIMCLSLADYFEEKDIEKLVNAF